MKTLRSAITIAMPVARLSPELAVGQQPISCPVKGLTLVAAILAWAAVPGAASDFDGSKLLVCANMEAAYCSSGQKCDSGRPYDIGAPNFIRIDLANKNIVGPERTTPIAIVEKGSEQLLLQGTELGYAWSLALDTNDGNLAATIVNRNEVVVLFGACTPH